MPIVEGKGLVPPRPVSIPVSTADLSYLRAIASKRDAHRRYGNSSSTWKRGLANNPILIGLVGEFAFSQYLQSRGIRASVVDERLSNGDGGKDAVICDTAYQIKTSAKAYSACLVRRVNESKRLVPHVCDRFVFCRWSDPEPKCDLRGWCDKDTIVELGKFRKGKRGNWFNSEIEDIHFLSMADLAMLIKQESESGK